MAHATGFNWFHRWERQSAWTSCAYAASGSLIGWISWGDSADIVRLMWIVLLPLVWGMAETRWRASLVMAGYYFMAARSLPGASDGFFGGAAPWWLGWVLWCSASALLTTPFVLIWSKQTATRPWRFVLAVCITVFPPFGLIGWTNLLFVAGVLFPGTAWAGLALTLSAFAVLVGRWRRWMILFSAVALLANIIAGETDTKAPQSWHGVDTSFSHLNNNSQYDPGQLSSALRRIEWIKDFATHMPANSVRVLPETVLGPINAVSEFALRSTESDLAAKDARILVGAEVPQTDGRYQNTVIVLGARGKEQRMAVQGIPVPVSMWKPWTSEGAVTDVFGFGNVIDVKGVRAGVLICYEQLLPFAFLRTMLKRPNVMVTVGNVWWAERPDVPNIQEQSIGAFDRLFGVPVVRARNW